MYRAQINYGFANTPFGKTIVASSQGNLVHISFCEKEKDALLELAKHFPKTKFIRKPEACHNVINKYFKKPFCIKKAALDHLKSTPFQKKVWQTLLTIPFGQTVTYGEIASKIGKPKAFRSVGTAIGRNPLAIVVPCHRVISSQGKYGMYRWGSARKQNLLEWERKDL